MRHSGWASIGRASDTARRRPSPARRTQPGVIYRPAPHHGPADPDRSAGAFPVYTPNVNRHRREHCWRCRERSPNAHARGFPRLLRALRPSRKECCPGVPPEDVRPAPPGPSMGIATAPSRPRPGTRSVLEALCYALCGALGFGTLRTRLIHRALSSINRSIVGASSVCREILWLP